MPGGMRMKIQPRWITEDDIWDYCNINILLLCHINITVPYTENYLVWTLRQKMNQPHGHAELQTQFQLSSEAQHLHYFMHELERDEKGKKIIEKFSLKAGFAGKTAVLLHGMVSLGEKLLPGKQEQPGCSRELFHCASQRRSCLIPGGKAWSAQLCCLPVSFTGEDEHNIPGRRANTLAGFTRDTIIPTEELEMQKRLFRPKPQRLTNHQRYGTSCLQETVLGSV